MDLMNLYYIVLYNHPLNQYVRLLVRAGDLDTARQQAREALPEDWTFTTGRMIDPMCTLQEL